MTDQVLGRDLRVVETPFGKDLEVQHGDLTLTRGRENLVQALTLRLRNNRGVLKQLGHPDYGSRLIEAVGMVATATNFQVLKNLVREAVLQDPRVGSIESLDVHHRIGQPGTIDVEVAVTPIRENTPLNLVVTLQTGGE